MGDTVEDDDGVATEAETGITSFSQLLLSDDVVPTSDNHRHGGAEAGEGGFGFGFSFTGGGPRMLCFGGEYQNDAELIFPESSVCRSESSSPISSSRNSSKSMNNGRRTLDTPTRSHKKRTGSGTTRDPDNDPKPVKKSRRDQNKSSAGNAKVRKEKLGERIAALQQLVSPYGKTDTASVLHEAMGYIKFLQDQVRALSSPYLLPRPREGGEEMESRRREKKDLRSRGLCLVPVSCTVHVAESNGADFWSPAMCHSSMSASLNH